MSSRSFLDKAQAKQTAKEEAKIEFQMADLPTAAHTTLPEKHKGAVLVVRWNGDGNYCMSGGRDRGIHLWNPHKGTHIKEYSGAHGYEVLDLEITPDSSKFASCGGDRVVFLWDVASGKTLRRMRGHTERVNTLGHTERVNTLGFNIGCSVLFTGSYDKNICAWDMRSNMHEPIQILSHFKDSVSSLKVGLESIRAGSIDGTIRYYDLRMGRVTTDHIGQPVTSISVSSDGNCTLASSTDSTLRLMDAETGELLNSYKGHLNKTYKVEAVLTKNDSHVVSGSENGDIYFWSLVDARIVKTVQAHNKVVTGLARHPKEPCLLSCSNDGNIKCWKTPEAAGASPMEY
eukprot:g48462.t1